jgi:hypothetical protein
VKCNDTGGLDDLLPEPEAPATEATAATEAQPT